jgi:hypothetical protein
MTFLICFTLRWRYKNEYNWDLKKFYFEFTLLERHHCICQEPLEILNVSENVKHIYSHDSIFVVYIELFEN